MYIYIFLLFYFTIHLIMTEARSKRRVLPFLSLKVFHFKTIYDLALVLCKNQRLVEVCCCHGNEAG